MTPVIISKTGTGRSPLFAADSFQTPFSIGLQITVTGVATFNVELTMDDVIDTPASAVWATAGTGFGALSASTVLALTTPCHGLSINITSGTGTVSAKIVQAGVR